jgi:molybdopterin-guanine dinucleotide biosynthesis protein A
MGVGNGTSAGIGIAVIVVAGGRSTRFDGDKLVTQVHGSPLRQHAIDAALRLTDNVVVVGPSDPSVAVRMVREDPEFGGPFAAVAAGVSALDLAPDDIVIVLAADLVDPGPALPALIDALANHGPNIDAAVLVDSGHHRQPLLSAFRAAPLQALLAATDPVGRPANQLFDGLHVIEVSDQGGWARDIDTAGDLADEIARPPQNP